MSALRFDITLPDGSKDALQTDAERVLIGRGAHCEIRLPEGDCALEHVVVEVVGATLRVIARSFSPPPTVNGEAVTEVTLSGEALLRIGAVSIRITPTEISPPQPPTKRDANSSLVRIVGLLAALVLGGMLLFRASRVKEQVPTAVPELWEGGAATCPLNTVAQARAFAFEKRIVADGKRERHPFYASDGVEAVALYETAAACLEKAGEGETAEELRASAQQLRSDVNDDFRVRRVRLERALAASENEVAAHELIMVRALLMGKQGPYIDWINRTARKLAVDKDSP